MLTSEARRKTIIERLSNLTTYIRLSNKQGLTDANKEAEDFFCGLLNLILNVSLGNMNRIQQDYPAIDLGDPAEALAVQVTSTNNHAKIQHTLDEFFGNELDQTYNQLIVLIIGEKIKYRNGFKIKRRFRFDADKDIWDTATLCDEIMALSDEKQEEVIRYLDAKMDLPKLFAEEPGEDPASVSVSLEPLVFLEKKLKYEMPTTLGAEGFVGRLEEQATLKQALDRQEKPIFITGLGGMGKTELAIRFCQEQTDFKVHFVRFAGTFRQTVTLNIAPSIENLHMGESRPEEQIYFEAMKVLEDCDSKTILIIDNVDPEDGNFDALKDDTYRDLCRMNLRLIITTRAPVRGGVAVEPMEMEQLLAIMHKYGQNRDEELIPLIEAVNRHTLTVDLMARTLDESWDEVTPAMLLEALRNSTLPEEDYPEVTTDHNRDEGQLRIYAHLRSLFNVTRMDEDAKTALCCATLLPEAGMETALFRRSLPAGAQKAVKTLDKRGFLRRDKGLVSIHPVVRLVACRELTPTDEICGEFLENLWGNYDRRRFNHDLHIQIAEVLTLAAEKLENKLGNWSAHGREIWDTVKQYGKALSCARMTLEKREISLPEDHPGLADAYNDLGLACLGVCDYRGMETYCGKALEIREQILEPNHVDLGKSYDNLGCIYEEKGNYSTALEYKLKALDILKKAALADDLDLADAYNSVGSAYFWLGEYSQALKYQKRALEIAQKVLPEDHPELAQHYAWMGSICEGMGNIYQALKYREHALRISEMLLPEDHPDLAESYREIGLSYNELGDYQKMLEYNGRALGIAQKVLPAGYLDLATYYCSAGKSYALVGDYQNALKYCKSALEVAQRTLPADHPNLAYYYSELGWCCSFLGDVQEAVINNKHAVEIVEKKLPADHPDFVFFYYRLGGAYEELGEYGKALEYHQMALELSQRIWSADRLALAESYIWMGAFENSIGNDETAMDLFQRSLEICKKVLPENHPYMAEVYTWIAAIYGRMGDYHKALIYNLKGVDVFKNTLSSDPLDIIACYHGAGWSYTELGDYEKAFEYHTRAMDICKRRLPPDNPRLASAYSWLGDFYEATKDYKKALDCYLEEMRIRERKLPANHPSIAYTYKRLGNIYSKMGDHVLARDYLNRALRIMEEKLPANHPDLKDMRENMNLVTENSHT